MPEKIAIITGCSSGIGRSTALLLAQNGFKVYATMRDTSKNTLEHSNIIIQKINVNSEETIKQAISEIIQNENRIDVLVNNAGYGFVGSIEDTSIQEMKEQFETDFFGPVNMIKNVIPIMKKQNSGVIINVSSIAGQMGFAFSSAYVSSKFALEGLTDSLRQEFSETKIKISSIEPGVVKTSFHQNMKRAQQSFTSEYKKFTELMIKNAEKLFQLGIESDEVARKILEVILIEEPEPRYTVGKDAALFMEDKKRMSGKEFEKSIKEFFKQIMES